MCPSLIATETANPAAMPARRLSTSRASPKPSSVTLAPAAASARAIPRPMPSVERVTMATLPASIGIGRIVRPSSRLRFLDDVLAECSPFLGRHLAGVGTRLRSLGVLVHRLAGLVRLQVHLGFHPGLAARPVLGLALVDRLAGLVLLELHLGVHGLLARGSLRIGGRGVLRLRERAGGA